MKESVFGTAVRKELNRLSVQVMKLHGSPFQRALPDMIMWFDEGQERVVELKVASSGQEAISKLTPGQRSVIMSLARTPRGALLVFGHKPDKGSSWGKPCLGGVMVLRGYADKLSSRPESTFFEEEKFSILIHEIACSLKKFLRDR